MSSISRRRFAAMSAATFAVAAALRIHAIRAAVRESGLKDAFGDDFLVGAAVNDETLASVDPARRDLIALEFNSVTAENCLKWANVEPEEGEWQWDCPDRFVEFGTQHGMTAVGHVLVWHSQAPEYLFIDDDGRPVSKERLEKHLENHIGTLVDRYRGRIGTWDVVNEAIDEDEKGWRQSPWLQILGPVYMERAFRLAHEADPEAKLLYNDYNEHNPGRRDFLVNVIRDYRRRGVPLHGVGFQGHIGLDYPDLDQYEQSIEAIAAEGLPVHITELEVDVLPHAWEFTGAEISSLEEYSAKLDPYVDGLPEDIARQQVDRYKQFFDLLLKHRASIERVTFWGLHDGDSWKNDFPVRGRTNYPLLYDRQLERKPVYYEVAALGEAGPP
jgi:endo-1,4-beta-xylanase